MDNKYSKTMDNKYSKTMDNKLKNLYKQFSENSGTVLSQAAKERVKGKVFQRLSEAGEPAEVAVSWWNRIRESMLLRSYVLIPLVLLLFIISTAAASASALPGDMLYPVKRQVESARILLAPTPEAKLDLKVNFAEQRLEEMEQVQSSGNSNTQQRKVNKPENDENTVNRNSNSIKTVSPDNTQSSNSREVKAKQEAENALNFLVQTKDQLQANQDTQRAEDLNKKIEDYRKLMLKNDSEHSTDNRGDSSGNTNQNRD